MIIRRILKATFGCGCLWGIAALGQAATATGQIKGSIETTSGQPVPGATVSILVRPSGSTASFQQFNTRVTTGADGTFTVAGVPQGKFAVCVNARSTNLLDPCVWESEPTVTLAEGQSLSMAPIQLQSGVDLYVRVNDPNASLASTEGKVPGASLMVGVRTPNGIITPIPKTASDAAGADHHLPVPPDTDLLFVAYSKTFKMTDITGAPIDQQAGLAKPIRISAFQAQLKEVITIP